MWYKNTVLYSLDVKAYYDSNGDGTGDLQGVISKLGYIRSLGVNCIWLLPFFPSPKLDNGYDVVDFYNVDPLLGSLGDFVRLIDEAKERGIRIIIDLIANHTSVKHPWFLESESSRESKYRHYYIWDDDPDTGSKMSDSEKSKWEYSEKTGSWYLHEYYEHMADLNLANQEVIDEICKIMEFWIRLGVSGFRIDAAHSVTNTVDVEHIDFGNLHTLFDRMNNLLREIRPDAILLGEADVEPKEINNYFISEKGDPRLHILFNFHANRYSFVAFAKKKGSALHPALEMYDDFSKAHWLNYVRHHDELNLKMLTENDRKKVWKEFAPDENMKVYGHGIRRRLPPMLKQDIRRMKLFYAMVFGFSGIPLINYGEEIGMGDDLNLKERESVRTPMQWSADTNGGFSAGPPEKLYRPVISKGDFNYKKVNVRDQQLDPDSFLSFMSKLIRARLQYPEIGEGRLHIMKPDDSKAAGWYFENKGQLMLVAYNLSEKKLVVSFKTDIKPDHLVSVFEDRKYNRKARLDQLDLHPYGYRWFQVITDNKK